MIPSVTSNDNFVFMLKANAVIQSLKHLRTFTRAHQSKEHQGAKYPPTQRESFASSTFKVNGCSLGCWLVSVVEAPRLLSLPTPCLWWLSSRVVPMITWRISRLLAKGHHISKFISHCVQDAFVMSSTFTEAALAVVDITVFSAKMAANLNSSSFFYDFEALQSA